MRKNLILSICFCLVSCSSSSAQEEIPDGDKTSYYRNPVIDYSLPDPTIIEGGDGYYYLYATEDIRNLPIHRSKDLINWEWVVQHSRIERVLILNRVEAYGLRISIR